MLDGFADSSKFPTETLKVVKRPASLSIESLQTMSGLFMSTFRGEEARKEEKIRNLWNPIVNRAVESLSKKGKYGVRGRYSSKKKLLFDYSVANK